MAVPRMLSLKSIVLAQRARSRSYFRDQNKLQPITEILEENKFIKSSKNKNQKKW